MTVPTLPEHLDLLGTHVEDRGVLRFITAGSVDDGKSTLIGRLLYDTKSILSDQLAALARAGERRGTNSPKGALDLAALTDGLEAEREQGITIDVAYRYFATGRRKFIIADTPGHEQYTRNMVTGASTADAAVILIDATRVVDGQLLPQTRRHSALARLLGIRHIVVAVNKLDQLDFSQQTFETIVSSYRAMAARLGLTEVTAIPISALHGDNVVSLSQQTPWYTGPHLLEWLESVPSALEENQQAQAPLRFAVQYVLRGFDPNEGGARGYAGRVGSGTIRPGQTVRVLPSGAVARVLSVGTFDGPLLEAQPGQSVVVRLDRELDISRGDWLAPEDAAAQPVEARQFTADLAWLDSSPLALQRKLWLRHGTRWVQARIRRIDEVLDLGAVEWRESEEQSTLGPNDIARVVVETQQPLALDPYDRVQTGGAFILADAATNHTVAAGMVRTAG
ncbi:MAG: 50S ribosome-binding GTPase [Chloroflexi bacterium]|nr:50S ribosome-binding GTPase [Chloroflexota bacterium]